MGPILWVVLVFLFSAGAGAVVFFIMRSRMEVILAQQRETLSEARANLSAQKEALEGSLKNVEEATRRKAMDEFLADIRVEERHYVREHKVLFLTRKSLVRQERIFFRNIPLSNWVENEMLFEEGADMDKLSRTLSVFAPELYLEGEAARVARKLLH